ncbi:hypothetical protein NIES2135_20600 [Leptolyngbya boryana NIES-2135]|jgi:hypothetical protein|uniref:Uncharacterized protein n=1 Tax=Leptolyngbya boryana NIES-2135 TaxID=1973484 RepID=A0A1Z4JFG9_LEPBY|nr:MULTISPECIES: Rad52/Rad22 family DNA repair protein [Leptolyngbya]BAY55237.1 hypothetical protein NIES2135_20600 [Leptolyngbya boryana NIES-2135]MBD2369322.1 hypothetical protein [Leptolyngbya sp. FACHB-161]MBD2375676.1 hypothetical protein [Leptolyngbya sp. FACHB-238]MBD2401651.1 hypothetical protein [Leptolyngbya sp. FACHB-239]MBD2406610.1 hypothetical protein [Leptolyngbya sp. FACHB-402]
MTIDLERFKEIQPKLKAWFPPEDHDERELPGTKAIWYFVKWQKIRDRLDEVCPDWEVEYSDPIVIEEEICIRCKITICGVSREAPGYAPLKLISNAGKNMARGSAGERATADAFKNSCELHGIARYLDEQADKDTKENFVRYMQKGGNGRAATHYRNNQQIANGSTPRTTPKPPPKPFGGTINGNTPKIITAAQRTRFYTIAKNNGWTDGAAKKLLSEHNFTSSTEITIAKYDELCKLLQDKSKAALYNSQAAPIHSAPEQNEWS